MGTEDVTCDGDHPAHFDSKNVGTRTATALNLVLGGADKDNYVLDNTSATDDAEISPAHLTASITADNKTYDGNDNATYSCDLTGVVGTEDVTCDGDHPAHFDSKNVGTRTATALNLVLGGADKDNYVLDNTSATDDAEISPAHLTASITADNKTYDGNDNATYSCDLTGVVGTEDVTCDGDHPAHFDSKNVGTRTATALNLVLGGADKDNYVLDNTSATDDAEISPAHLTVVFTAASKPWDGNNNATILTCTVSGRVGTEDVTCDYSAATAHFSSSLVGTWTVTGSGFGLAGADKANYVIGAVNTTMGSITPWSAAGTGFYPPVGVTNSVFTAAPGLAPGSIPANVPWNTIKGGQTVPLKFNVFAGIVEKTTLD